MGRRRWPALGPVRGGATAALPAPSASVRPVSPSTSSRSALAPPRDVQTPTPPPGPPPRRGPTWQRLPAAVGAECAPGRDGGEDGLWPYSA